MRKILFLTVAISILVSKPCLAERIVLHSGKVVDGEMIQMNADTITLEVFGVPATYNLADVESIDGKPFVMPPKLITPAVSASAQASVSSQNSTFTEIAPSEAKQPVKQQAAEPVKQKRKSSSKAIAEKQQAPQKIEVPDTQVEPVAGQRNLDDARAYFEIGYIHQSLGEDELAKESYKKALAIDPNLGQKFFNEAVDNYYLSNYSQARDEFARARALFDVQNDFRMVSVVDEQLRKFFLPTIPEPVDNELER